MDQGLLRQSGHKLTVATAGRGFTDISDDLRRWLAEIEAGDGLVTAFIRHTSASLVIQENADPDVRADLTDALAAMAPERSGYRHNSEGPDDMPAHIKSMLTATSLAIPVIDGALQLGTWQSLFVVEHRARNHQRQVVLHYQGT